MYTTKGGFVMQQDYTRVHSASQTKKAVFKGVVYAFLIIWALIVLFPFYWMVLSSIKSYGDYNAEFIPQFITKNPTFENYVSAFSAELYRIPLQTAKEAGTRCT